MCVWLFSNQNIIGGQCFDLNQKQLKRYYSGILSFYLFQHKFQRDSLILCDNLKTEDGLKTEVELILKNKDNLKNEEDLMNENNPKK